MNPELTSHVARWQERVETQLQHWLPKPEIQPQRLHEAMRYAALGAGKRVRPILAYATGHCLGISEATLDGPACAVELIHAYSLVHDDLPCMDDDDLRRGEPTVHRAYDEATAMLVGDALQSLAFYVLAHTSADIPASQRVAMVESLALAAGSRGMAGGQAIDIAAVGKQLDRTELEHMHIHKTGALLRSSVRLAMWCKTDLDAGTRARLDHYATSIGLAFQVRDDILDVEGNDAQIGKPQGSDAEANKPTFPSIVGLAESRAVAQDLHEAAMDSLSTFDDRADPLRQLSEYIVGRDR